MQLHKEPSSKFSRPAVVRRAVLAAVPSPPCHCAARSTSSRWASSPSSSSVRTSGQAGKHHDRDPVTDGVPCPRPASSLARIRVGWLVMKRADASLGACS
jgi:hypothetical protein